MAVLRPVHYTGKLFKKFRTDLPMHMIDWLIPYFIVPLIALCFESKKKKINENKLGLVYLSQLWYIIGALSSP